MSMTYIAAPPTPAALIRAVIALFAAAVLLAWSALLAWMAYRIARGLWWQICADWRRWRNRGRGFDVVPAPR